MSAGGHGQGTRHVVEPAARVVQGQEGGRLDLESKQVSDCVAVLGAIEPMQTRRRQVHGGRAIQLVLHPADQSFEGLGLRTRSARRWHHACPELPDDLLSGVGVVAEAREVELVQLETGRVESPIVTRDAIPLEHGSGLRRRGGRSNLALTANHSN